MVERKAEQNATCTESNENEQGITDPRQRLGNNEYH